MDENDMCSTTSTKNTDQLLDKVNSIKIRHIPITKLQSSYLLQSKMWAQVKTDFSWKAYAFRQNMFSDLEQDVLVLVRRISILGYFAYIPDGIVKPMCESIDNRNYVQMLDIQLQNAFELISTISSCLKNELNNSLGTVPNIHRKNSPIFHSRHILLTIRWDMPWVCRKTVGQNISLFELFQNHTKINKFNKNYNIYLRETVQAPATVLLDLSQELGDILAHMKSKTRYNIGLGKKKGLVIKDNVSIDEFYKLYQITSQRNHIAIHKKEYYQKVFETLGNDDDSEVHCYGAEFQKKLIAIIVVVYYRGKDKHRKATYLYGASSDEQRALMPSYALQWHALKEAKEKGCGVYDMFGIPHYAKQGHRMFGIYKFKIGFGGAVVFRLGAYDIISKDVSYRMVHFLRYKLFILSEKIRHWYYYEYKKQ